MYHIKISTFYHHYRVITFWGFLVFGPYMITSFAKSISEYTVKTNVKPLENDVDDTAMALNNVNETYDGYNGSRTNVTNYNGSVPELELEERAGITTALTVTSLVFTAINMAVTTFAQLYYIWNTELEDFDVSNFWTSG